MNKIELVEYFEKHGKTLRTALLACIQKYRELPSYWGELKKGEPTSLGYLPYDEIVRSHYPSIHNCGLCAMFYADSSESSTCSGCPLGSCNTHEPWASVIKSLNTKDKPSFVTACAAMVTTLETALRVHDNEKLKQQAAFGGVSERAERVFQALTVPRMPSQQAFQSVMQSSAFASSQVIARQPMKLDKPPRPTDEEIERKCRSRWGEARYRPTGDYRMPVAGEPYVNYKGDLSRCIESHPPGGSRWVLEVVPYGPPTTKQLDNVSVCDDKRWRATGEFRRPEVDESIWSRSNYVRTRFRENHKVTTGWIIRLVEGLEVPTEKDCKVYHETGKPNNLKVKDPDGRNHFLSSVGHLKNFIGYVYAWKGVNRVAATPIVWIHSAGIATVRPNRRISEVTKPFAVRFVNNTRVFPDEAEPDPVKPKKG